MRVEVDTEKCEAHGDCVVAAPEIFDLDDDDLVVKVLMPEVGEDMRAELEQAARDCPVSAITIVED
jgi:ferredoxin